MPSVGGLLSRARALALGLLLGASGCVRDAVLENEIRSARAKAVALATITDLTVAEAALSAQLVELEALYLQAQNPSKVSELLDAGYALLAQGFIEVRRLEALAAGDTAQAERERRLQLDADARAAFYRAHAESGPAPVDLKSELLGAADVACSAHDRSAYERHLHALLARAARAPGEKLRLALAQRLAAAWLMPNVAARCRFGAAATEAEPKAP